MGRLVSARKRLLRTRLRLARVILDFSSQTAPDLSTAMLILLGLKSCWARAAEGRLTLMFSDLFICRLIIMNEARRKNMMSIKGIMTIRERRRGMGDASFMVSVLCRRRWGGV